MSTNALAFGIRDSDNPWRRLYWTLPAALSIWLAVLWAFAYFVRSPGERLPEPRPVEAQLIELPAPTPTVHGVPEEKRSTPPPVKPLVPRTTQSRPLHPAPQVSVEKNPSPVQDEKPAVAPSSIPASTLPKGPPPPVREQPNTPSTNLTGTSGAQAIVRPMPQIPEELREDALSASALARFHVAVDGTVTVDLVKPTPNPRLNRLLLDTLKNWRFFPAMKEGKPVASTEEIVIKVEVK
jgi:protein TonB